MNHLCKPFIQKLLLLCTVACGAIMPVAAQENPYGIDDELYAIYQRAFRQRFNPKCLPIADTLYNEAVKKKDLKAQCLAYVIPLNYYNNRKNYDSLVIAVNKCQEISRKNGYLQYYYFAYGQQINWLLNQGHIWRALQLSNNMREQAYSDNYDYGIVLCLRYQGYIYQMRHNDDIAAERFKEALNYLTNSVQDQDPTSFCVALSEYYRQKVPPIYDEAMKYVDRGLKEARSYESRMNAMMEKCILHFQMGQMDKFDNLYKKCMSEIEKNGEVQLAKLMRLRIFKCIEQKDYERAYLLTDSMDNYEAMLKMKLRVALLQEDYKNAYTLSERINRYNDSLRLQIQMSDLAEATVQIDKERIMRENGVLEMKVTKLSVIAIFAILFVGAVLAYLYKKHKMDVELQRKHAELMVAYDKAESASKMKSNFIHNMSHEIRTPLNAIVGFSQVISAPDIELGQEERKEFCNLIERNGELLTTLINDILDLAALESGKYHMQYGEQGVNELCRLEVQTLMNRKPENVKFYYTTEVPDDFKIITDEKRLRQVLSNFITNSMKHTEEGEIHLHCSVTENPGMVTFSVTDTGDGVPADKVDQLFQRFAKLNTTKQGTGLGLNICSVIADLLKGEVYYDKNYTNGARFVFVHPMDGRPEVEGITPPPLM